MTDIYFLSVIVTVFEWANGEERFAHIEQSCRNYAILKFQRNAIFPHFADGQICGYEIKNSHFTFAPGGKRGLWCSVWSTLSVNLVITESAIDALSQLPTTCDHCRQVFVEFCSLGATDCR